jgi:hypothetical protein
MAGSSGDGREEEFIFKEKKRNTRNVFQQTSSSKKSLFTLEELATLGCPPRIKKLNKNTENSSKLQRVQIIQAEAS